MVFVIGSSSWKDGAAVPSHFKALADELVRRGHQVIILVAGHAMEAEERNGNPLIFNWPSRRPTKMRDAIFAHRLFSRYRPDCLIANFGAVNLMTIIGWLTGAPVRVVWYHTLYEAIKIDDKLPAWKRKALTLRKRMVYRLATRFVPVTLAAQQDLCSVFGVPPERCSVFYNPLDDPAGSDQPQTNSSSSGDFRIVCVGRFDPVKGQDVLIRALPAIKAEFPNLKVNFVGDGAQKDTCQQLARSLGVQDLCVFLGNASHAEVLNLIKASDVSVIPSRSDNCPMVLIESLACGKPVIASRVGGIPELMDDGVEGFLTPPDDPEALAEKIRRLLQDRALRAAVSMNARNRFLKDYDLRSAVSREATWLEQITNTGSSGWAAYKK
ncbi:MAG: glycosyltransferase family 4 protein [Blastocatellales bacterium]